MVSSTRCATASRGGKGAVTTRRSGSSRTRFSATTLWIPRGSGSAQREYSSVTTAPLAARPVTCTRSSQPGTETRSIPTGGPVTAGVADGPSAGIGSST